MAEMMSSVLWRSHYFTTTTPWFQECLSSLNRRLSSTASLWFRSNLFQNFFFCFSHGFISASTVSHLLVLNLTWHNTSSLFLLTTIRPRLPSGSYSFVIDSCVLGLFCTASLKGWMKKYRLSCSFSNIFIMIFSRIAAVFSLVFMVMNQQLEDQLKKSDKLIFFRG